MEFASSDKALGLCMRRGHREFGLSKSLGQSGDAMSAVVLDQVN